jgi:hypothetical protein
MAGALSLDIMPSGSKVWRYAYRIHGKQKTFTIGKYPDTSLSDARTSRDKAKMLVRTVLTLNNKNKTNYKMPNHSGFLSRHC